MTRNSLNFRFWLTIAIAVVPVFLFVLFDYQERRTQTVARIHAEIARHLSDADREAQAAQRTVRLTLQIMARSNDLQTLNPEACSAIARRRRRWCSRESSAAPRSGS